jgi:hypothetical protein
MDPVASYLYGSSSVISSTSQFLMNREQAQIYHQMALQKQVETAKMVFDLNKYIKENTPTFSDEQRKIAEDTLKRILKNAAPSEIWSGRALNIILKDLKQQDLDKYNLKPVIIPAEILRQLNITAGNNGSLGILKDNGRFNWPLALLDDEVVSKAKRDDIQIQAEQLVKQALGGTLDPNTYKDLRANINLIREKLPEKITSIPGTEYMQAKRFLENFDEALNALQKPNVAKAYLDFQKFTTKDRTLPELVAYMTKYGMSFAPSSPGDEAAYEAVYSNLANMDLIFNTQLVSGKKP